MNCCMCCVRPGFTQALNRTEFHSVHQKRTSIKKEGEARAVSDSEGRDTASRFELSHDYEAPRRRYIWYRTLTHVNTQTILYITMCNQDRNYLSLSLQSRRREEERAPHEAITHVAHPNRGEGDSGRKSSPDGLRRRCEVIAEEREKEGPKERHESIVYRGWMTAV